MVTRARKRQQQRQVRRNGFYEREEWFPRKWSSVSLSQPCCVDAGTNCTQTCDECEIHETTVRTQTITLAMNVPRQWSVSTFCVCVDCMWNSFSRFKPLPVQFTPYWPVKSNRSRPFLLAAASIQGEDPARLTGTSFVTFTFERFAQSQATTS
jgi:hypothetical protein